MLKCTWQGNISLYILKYFMHLVSIQQEEYELMCPWQENMHAGMKIFHALDFGAAVNRLLKCTWQENMHTGLTIFDALDFGAAGGSCVHLARKYAHRFENILMHFISVQQGVKCQSAVGKKLCTQVRNF